MLRIPEKTFYFPKRNKDGITVIISYIIEVYISEISSFDPALLEALADLFLASHLDSEHHPHRALFQMDGVKDGPCPSLKRECGLGHTLDMK